MVEIGEVCRRAIWNFFRIEWEILSQQDRLALGDEEEADKMLIKIPKQVNGLSSFII
jgi:hypothetical protein